MIFIFVLALLIFGPRKLPELGRTVGRAMTEFRRASTEVRVAIEDEMREMERQAREVTREARQAVEEGMPSLEGEPAGSGTIAREPQPSAVPPEPGPQAADGDHAKS